MVFSVSATAVQLGMCLRRLDGPRRKRRTLLVSQCQPDPIDGEILQGDGGAFLVLAGRRSCPVADSQVRPQDIRFGTVQMFPVTAEPQVKASASGTWSSRTERASLAPGIFAWQPAEAAAGWSGNWGMAASSEDNDYVHLVTSALARHTGSRPQILVSNIAGFERNYATYDV